MDPDRTKSKDALQYRDRARVVEILRSYPLQYPAKKRISAVLASKVDADDIIQDIMVILFRRVSPGDVFRMHAAGELRRWLQTVIRNHVTAVVRVLATKSRFNGHRTYGQADQFESGSFALCNGILDGGRSPSSEEAAVEAKDAMLAVLVNLPPMERRALSLHIEGLPPPDIAKIMGHSLGVIRGLLHRGRGMLRARMGPADQWFSGADSEERLADVLGFSSNANDT